MAAWDAAGIIVAQNIYGYTRLGSWISPGKTTVAITLIFLTVSYILGRYSQKESEGRKSKYRRAVIAVVLSTAISGLLSWGMGDSDAQLLLRGPVAVILVITGIWSETGHLFINKESKKNNKWEVICSAEEWRELKRLSIGSGIQLVRIQDEEELGIDLERRKARWIAISKQGIQDQSLYRKLESLKTNGATVRSLLWLAETMLQTIPGRLVDEMWLIASEGFGVVPGTRRWRIKRLGDIAASLILVVVTAPLALGAILLVWLEDGEDPLYSQIRTGLYGKPFRIWKIRSMRIDAEEEGAEWALANDKRITKVGRIIRATRIDELPQLISVLKGEMSMVGPRPERPEFDRVFMGRLRNYRVRYNALPGITGWSQVCFRYGASEEDTEIKLAYDLYYLKNSSMLLDALVFIKTARLVMSASGYRPERKSGEKGT